MYLAFYAKTYNQLITIPSHYVITAEEGIIKTATK